MQWLTRSLTAGLQRQEMEHLVTRIESYVASVIQNHFSGVSQHQHHQHHHHHHHHVVRAQGWRHPRTSAHRHTDYDFESRPIDVMMGACQQVLKLGILCVYCV